MKRIIALISVLAMLGTTPAFADTCGKKMTGTFTSFQAAKLCATFLGSSSMSASLIPGTDNTYDIGDTTHTLRTLYTGTSIIALTSEILRVRQDSQRLFTFDGSSDTALTLLFGDAGVTATQGLLIGASTSDADDDSTLSLAGGGAAGITRGAYITLAGNETAGDGDALVSAGSDANSDVSLVAPGSSSVVKATISGKTDTLQLAASSDTALKMTFGDAGVTAVQQLTVSASTADADDDSSLILAGGGADGGTRGASITLPGEEVSGGSDITYNAGTGDTHIFNVAGTTEMTVAGTSVSLAGAGDLNFSVGLATIALQEAVAGTACSGTLTANGATPVVTSTSCATTGSRIFLSRTSAETGTVSAWKSALSNGVSFSITSEAADTGTYDWFIIHEAP